MISRQNHLEQLSGNNSAILQATIKITLIQSKTLKEINNLSRSFFKLFIGAIADSTSFFNLILGISYTYQSNRIR